MPALSRIVAALSRALVGAWLLVAGHAAAAPELDALIAWQGECDDRAALRAEIQARGADLNEVVASDTAVKLGIVVRQSAGNLLADIELTAAGSHESRHVEARDCLALRRAVAWVLGVFAEERAAAERTPQPSTAVFPVPPPPAAPAPAPKPATRQLTPRVTRPEQPPPPRVKATRPCAAPGPRFSLGSELLLGAGFVRAASLGPALIGSYRPCARWWPGFSVGVSELVSLGYEVDARAIRLERRAGQLGAWLTLGLPELRGGLSLEAGRLHAASTTSPAGPGGFSNALWLAFAAPLELDVPLFSSALTANLGVSGVYAPLRYVLRYATAGELARLGHFELRTAIGLSGHF